MWFCDGMSIWQFSARWLTCIRISLACFHCDGAQTSKTFQNSLYEWYLPCAHTHFENHMFVCGSTGTVSFVWKNGLSNAVCDESTCVLLHCRNCIRILFTWALTIQTYSRVSAYHFRDNTSNLGSGRRQQIYTSTKCHLQWVHAYASACQVAWHDKISCAAYRPASLEASTTLELDFGFDDRRPACIPHLPPQGKYD